MLCRCALLLAFYCTSSAWGQGNIASAAGLINIPFQQAWIPDNIYLPYMAALDQGYYARYGIHFVNQVGSGAGTSTKVVGAGSAPLGNGGAAIVLQAIAAGVPITIIMTENQQDPSGICALKSRGIRTARDLLGKRIAASAGDTVQQDVVLALNDAGLDPTSIHWVTVAPATKETLLAAGRVDAITCSLLSQPIDLQERGVAIITLSVAALGLQVPFLTTFVNNDFLRRHRALVQSFLRATVQGYRFVAAHPALAASDEHHHYPEVAVATVERQWQLSVPFLTSPIVDRYGFGWNDAARFQKLIAALVKGGQLAHPLDPTAVFTNSVLQSIPLSERTIQQLH
jgi:NitT/TauT family transport system substrate-binding protein